jgi:hypothetical protein
VLAAFFCSGIDSPAGAQTISYRGFIESRGVVFPQDAINDPDNLVGDALARAEVFLAPASWLRVAAGVDLRASTHDQVDSAWRFDLADRGTRRPRFSVRRLSAALTRGPLTVDLGKQFIRWGKADIVTPTDRFAPRDYLNVLDADFLAVRGARTVFEKGAHTLDLTWVPFFTPSRLPLFDQRWAPPVSGVTLVPVAENPLPGRSQFGARWSQTTGRFESSLSFYDGFNHLPNIEVPALLPFVGTDFPAAIPVTRSYPQLRMWGADAAAPTRWLTMKGEVAYFASSTATADKYVLYVVQLERQTGEWSLVGGYAGEVVTERRSRFNFAPDRGTTRTILGRASYTIDVNRSAAVEGAVRQDGNGLYVKGEFSQARGSHWRATAAGALIRGEPGDFLGQYRRNSHIGLTVRYSF